MLSTIVAIANNNVIGKDNKLIWHLPEDLKRFKQITTGKNIIMGRKTFESLGRVLPNRKHIILCNDMEMDILMDSNYLNDSLKIVLNNVVSYKLRNGTKLTNDNIYDMIVNDVNSDPTINNELKNKVITKGSIYKADISEYIYDLNINLINNS